MAGENSRIHGYNRIYRANQGRYECFELQNGRPTNFHNEPVAINPERVDGILDHQAHIVPQNSLNIVLEPIAAAMAEQQDLNGVNQYINDPNTPDWLMHVRAYGNAIQAPMYDFDEHDIEDRVGGFFSIVMWNPVNICRAPEDAERANPPNDNIDVQVVDWLERYQNAENLPDEFLMSLRNLANDGPNNLELIEAYIQQCCNTLDAQIRNARGYYQFIWNDSPEGLTPPTL